MRNQLNAFRRGLADGFKRPVGERTIMAIMVGSAVASAVVLVLSARYG